MIRFANREDIPDIMRFIDKHWKKGHILARNKEEFVYEYGNGSSVNMVISEDENGKINGIEGFIPYGKKNRDIMLALWKVIKTDNPMLGIEILQFIDRHADARSISCPGINAKVIGIYQYMGYTTGQMTQWYRLNAMEDYRIAKVKNPEIPVPWDMKQYDMQQFSSFKELQNVFDFSGYYRQNPRPLKEAWYIEKRYFRHPIYRYMVYGIMNGRKAETILVFRIQPHEKRQALRCVDIIGNDTLFYQVTDGIDRLVKSLDAEYVDFYETGLSEERMESAGWKKVKDSGNVIPNYFSPFVQENIDINYMAQEKEVVLFKADGDQDRPN